MATDTTREQMDRYGLACLKAFLLVNAGAAVALLALISHLIAERPSLPSGVTNEIFHALEIFVWGLILGVATTGISYLGTWCYGHGERVGEEDRWNAIGENIFMALGSWSSWSTSRR